ncbi:MAG: hypothetical protein KAS69_00595 [Planctomycetes bacterium]|nr:hypothetical protein [Planctomycetota bacterium]
MVYQKSIVNSYLESFLTRQAGERKIIAIGGTPLRRNRWIVLFAKML